VTGQREPAGDPQEVPLRALFPGQNLGYNIFCSGFAHLMDGSLFIAGGNKDQQLNGLVNTTYFNPDTNQWSPGPNMATGRWYPTVTALNNGEQLITSGGPLIPEVRQNNGTLRSLSNASLSLPLYLGSMSRRTGARSTRVPIRRCASSIRATAAPGSPTSSVTRSTAATAGTPCSTSGKSWSPGAGPRLRAQR
jgi:hypothetical protein